MSTLIDNAFAEGFASEWIEAWNRHDLDAVSAHYSGDFEMSSPYIVQIVGELSGKLSGKAAVRDYWRKALVLIPDLKFELFSVLTGVDSITICYKGAGGRFVAETFHFAADRKVAKAYSHYALYVP